MCGGKKENGNGFWTLVFTFSCTYWCHSWYIRAVLKPRFARVSHVWLTLNSPPLCPPLTLLSIYGTWQFTSTDLSVTNAVCILIIFGRNVTETAIKQWFVFPPQLILIFLHYLAKHEKHIFSLKCSITALPEFRQSLLDFFSIIDLHLILTLLCDSLNLIINWVHLWAVGAAAQQTWGWEFCTTAVEICCAHHALVHYDAGRQNCHP